MNATDTDTRPRTGPGADATPNALPFGLDRTTLARNWWAFVLRGVIALVFAVAAFAMPAAALYALTIVFGAFSFADGLMGLVAAYRKMRAGESWGWLALSGLLGVLVGIAVIVLPFVATVTLALLLAVSVATWSILSGAFEITAAIRLRREIEGEVWLGLGGLVSILLGLGVLFFLFTRPVESLLAVGWMLGLYAVVFGVAMIVLGLRLRRERNDPVEPTDRRPEA
ncbi:HdeD family acid-resistance protein [Jannaschia sp. LMIT008]|uniref:HdeD family acid-resistance protein n=1 Tax=Jannaschia maritima TaxID=3032585 RepID=UPI00281124F2|nr:HdeD family acid-resistance protein [Jannaschia sp. LMIT008]